MWFIPFGTADSSTARERAYLAAALPAAWLNRQSSRQVASVRLVQVTSPCSRDD